MFSSLPTRHHTKIMKPENWHLGRDHGTLIQPPSRPAPPTPITDRNKKSPVWSRTGRPKTNPWKLADN